MQLCCIAACQRQLTATESIVLPPCEDAAMRQIPSHLPSRPDMSVWVRHCAKCDPSRVMNIKTVRPAMFGGYDLVIYECRQCGVEAFGPIE